LLYIQPAIVLFAVAGIARLASSLPPARWKPAKRAVLLALATGLAFGLETFEIPQRRHSGFSEAAEDLLANAELRKSVFLICADAQGEGAFISEVATREKRPGHIVLRGNKMLARTNWNGTLYQLLYKTPEQVATYLESVPVGVLVVAVTGEQRQMEHRRLVREMLDSHADRWKLIGAYPRERRTTSPGAEIRAYRLVGSESRPGGKIRVDLRGRLGKVIEH
jgi:hypothetical protein